MLSESPKDFAIPYGVGPISSPYAAEQRQVTSSYTFNNPSLIQGSTEITAVLVETGHVLPSFSALGPPHGRGRLPF